jgi:NAD+ synthase (glutamine-hydrolysing)
MRRLRIAMAQINTTVGDFDGNVKKILGAIDNARVVKADIVTLPELAICGYPPEDLLFKPQFIQANLQSLQKIVEASQGITVVVGYVDSDGDIYNAAALISDGKLIGTYHKMYLPNYGVFDENRYFRAGGECPVYVINGIGIGINICEDIWYEAGPATVQAYAGAEVIINISASPYHAGKGESREKMIATRALDNVAIFAYNNLVGGQDELVFDGHSLLIDERGYLIAAGNSLRKISLWLTSISRRYSGRASTTPGGGKNHRCWGKLGGTRLKQSYRKHLIIIKNHPLNLDISQLWNRRRKFIRRWCWEQGIISTRTASKKW